MIKKLFILFIIFGTSTMLQAHCSSCGTGDMKSKEKTYSKKEYVKSKVESLSSDLNLSKKQEKKLGKILKERKKELKQVRKKYRDEIKAILTEDQIKAFEEIVIDSHH